jgi:hypothetical protein
VRARRYSVLNLRTYARGKPCMVRLPCCNGNPETTVLAHVRLIGVSGMGIKSPDVCAAWACSDCHDAIDGRANVAGFEREFVRLAHLEGMVRTLDGLTKEGILSW